MPSLGKDLAMIREHLGLSIQDVQNATKLPLNTLKSIESGDIFEQKEENITYVRSFVRTYARNLKLDEELVNRALDQEEIGNYNHLLLSDFPELSVKVQPQKKTDKPKKPDKEQAQKEEDEDKPSESEAENSSGKSRFVTDFPDDDTVSDPVPETAAAGEPGPKVKPKPAPHVRNVNWADMGRKFSSSERKTPVWIIGAVVVLLAVLTGLYFISQSDLFTGDDAAITEPSSSSPQTTQELDSDGLALDLTGEPQNNTAEETPVLQDTLYLTVYAANDILDPVRVWSDLKPRIDPYWIEQGTAFNFEFSDTIRVRGQYARMLLFLNGHLIENFRQEYFNSDDNAVELTRSIFEDDPEWAIEVPMEVPANVTPPDTVVNRPAF